MVETLDTSSILATVLQKIADPEFQQALEKSVGHSEGRHLEILRAHPLLLELARLVEDAKREVLEKLDYYIELVLESMRRNSVEPYLVHDAREAREVVGKIVGQGKIVVFSKSMVAEELGLYDYLRELGNEVWDTDTGELIVRLADSKPMHTIVPAVHMSREMIVKVLNKKLGSRLPLDATPEEIVSVIRGFLREKIARANVGVTGANAVAADTGSVVLVENESNIRLVSSLPPVHIIVASIEKLYPNLSTALAAAIVQAAWAGLYPPTYINIITGPSSTADIEMKRVYGAQGPTKVYFILVDNGRKSVAQHPVLREMLKCIKCGRCQWECPVWQHTANYWGGPVYGGPMGVGWTAITRSVREASMLSILCLGCGRCDEVCPVHVPLTRIIHWLKQEYMKS